MIKQYGDKNVKITVGLEHELIVVINSNGESNAVDKEAKTQGMS
jgi:hypothetical protein